MPTIQVVEWIRTKFLSLTPDLNERSRRMWAAVEAASLGRGGPSAVSAATGMSRNTIRSGLRALRPGGCQATLGPGRIRQPGGGRKPLTQTYDELSDQLRSLVESSTRGDPESPVLWTCKSTRHLAVELTALGCPASYRTVDRLLRGWDYSLQSNRQTREGTGHPDRNAQFEHISRQARLFQRRGQPVISVDTQKKEWVGDFRNAGREWRPQGQPLEVRVHDFLDQDLGKAIPYGVYDFTRNAAWVSVGLDHDTAEFAAQAIARWWSRLGRRRYPKARELYLTADGGGSNGSRSRLWKVALQRLANRTGLSLSVSHFPPGTSKWNKLEHRLFCHITQNWRGRPLLSHDIIVTLISGTTTAQGLRVQAALVRKAGRRGASALSQQELHELTRLYPAVAVDVARCRMHKMDARTQGRVNSLALAAHGLLYRRRRARAGPAVWEFLAGGYPRLFRRLGAYVLLATAIFAAGTSGAYVSVRLDPVNAHIFVPRGLEADGDGGPATARDISERYRRIPSPPMASLIMTNNISVAFLAFALGILAGIGTGCVLLVNSMMLGGFFAHFANAGLSYDCWSFLVPHGALEIFAILVASAAGLRMGLSLALPGRRSRLASLRAGAQEAALLVLGTIPMFIVAGIIESFVTPSHVPGAAKIALGAGVLGITLAYLLLAGRGRKSEIRHPGSGSV